jgi:hypothetical protein
MYLLAPVLEHNWGVFLPIDSPQGLGYRAPAQDELLEGTLFREASVLQTLGPSLQ